MLKKTFFLLLFSTLIIQVNSQPTDTLVVGYNISPPFSMEEQGKIYGPSVWLWEQVAAQHNIPYKTKRMSLDSLLTAIANGEVHISASPLTITSNRFEKIDFTTPFYIAHSSVLVNKISATQQALNFIRSFFSMNFFRAMGALAFVILIFGFLEWYFERNRNEDEFGKGLKGLWQGFWWSAVTMTTVGYGDKSPKTVGGRIVALVWMFTAIIIISGFTASIASSLTVNQMQSDVSALNDFKEKQLGTVESSGTEKWLIDNFFNNIQSYANTEELIEGLRNENIDAVAYDRPLLQNRLHSDTLSEFTLLDIKYNPQFYAFGLNRELPNELKRKISEAILENTESMDWKVHLSEYDLR